ncbi:MAG TPA: glycoside hydrolase family 2 protein, partial [Bacteroidales bacterium]|nr:glycoside hydrolase family 2 protein [Bacteroidales bacterium]
MKKKILFLMLLVSQALPAQQIAWPEMTSENKPWTRWWWPGSIVTKPDLTAAMEKYRDAGLGGMEIAVIYGVKGQEDKFINYLSPLWMDMFTHVLKEGERLDLGIELANASGWPFGGPWVSPADATKNVNYKTWTKAGGDSLKEKVEFIQQPLVRPVGERPDIKKLKDPISLNDNLQLYALDQIRFEKPIPLKTLMAYSDSGIVADLTGFVTPEGKLDWTAPPGKWTLYGVFQGWHGKMAERAGPGGEGEVIDHFSGLAIDNYLKHFDTIFKDYDIKSLRGYFNDSYEVDDASGQADWTNDLFSEFIIRRGYDLRGHLPALFQKDDPDKNERVLSDYRQTISDLILAKFTTHWTDWAHRQGKTTRNQAHGSPGNILDLYDASDIPETEGNELTRLKFASSAANVTGKKYASCEAATWLNEHFLSSLGDIRKAVDLFFLAGINHVFYHGTCFSPQDEPWPGFLFYAAVELTPANPLWRDFSGLNKYVSRVQSFLQQGMADNDILLYFPVFDRYADPGKGMLEHFDAISPAFNGTPFRTAADEMIRKGYGFDYISDLQLTNTVPLGGLLQTEGNVYGTLVVPGCKYIPVETFSHILRLANGGAKVIFLGDLPENISGWGDAQEKTAFFETLKSGIRFAPTNNPQVMKASYGEGSLLTGSNLEQLMIFAGIPRETMSDQGLAFARRQNLNGTVYFITSQSDKPFDGWVSLQASGLSAGIFNPMDDRLGLARSRVTAGGNLEVYLRINPDESLILQTYETVQKGKPYQYYDPVSAPAKISGTWKVEFIEGGPSLPASVESAVPVSWTSLEGDEYQNFSGTARYTVNFKKPPVKGDAWLLDLGKVYNSASVTLNGNKVAVLPGPGFSVVIGKKLLKANNSLLIEVSNLMANRIAWMDRNGVQWKKFYNVNMAARLRENNKNGVFDASAWEPLESGLPGPVTIT